MKTLPTPQELLKKATGLGKKGPDLLEKYKESIILLKEKGFNFTEIEKFLGDNGIHIKKHKISVFLRGKGIKKQTVETKENV